MASSYIPVDHTRDPCPWRIIEDAGAAFAMGTIGGSMWHFVKGFKNSPSGDKIMGGYNSMKFRGPVLGGNFAVWSSLFNSFDCSLIQLRRKEDPWNAIISGALTGGCLAARGGTGMIVRSAIFGGVFLAIFEGVMIAFNRMSAEPYRPPGAMETQ